MVDLVFRTIIKWSEEQTEQLSKWLNILNDIDSESFSNIEMFISENNLELNKWDDWMFSTMMVIFDTYSERLITFAIDTEDPNLEKIKESLATIKSELSIYVDEFNCAFDNIFDDFTFDVSEDLPKLIDHID